MSQVNQTMGKIIQGCGTSEKRLFEKAQVEEASLQMLSELHKVGA